jgi:hypothetical protein
MVFWLSIFLSSICILKTKKSERQVGRWDVLFFLSSWQIFDLLIWRDYLAQSNIGNASNSSNNLVHQKARHTDRA